jgi:RHS repeat-associated protein
VTAENDYHVFAPWRVTDINGNTTEIAHDPLGVVVVSTLYGTKDGVPVGDDPLSEYAWQPDPTFGSVLQDPARYVRNASAYYFYDLFAWTRRRQPQPMVGIRRQDYVHGEPAGEVALPQTAITYSDGLGRVVQNKLRTDPGQDQGGGERWITSGQVTYNNKGMVTERYLPFFSPDPAYERRAPGPLPPPTVYHYDPLGRVIRTDTPKGFFSAVSYSPWTVRGYDEDDTVRDSAFYRNFPEHPDTPTGKAERAALDLAAGFYNTPATAILDESGRIVRTLADNLGGITPADLAAVVDGSGKTPQEVWDELVSDGYLAPDPAIAATAWVTAWLQPYDAGFRARFAGQYGPLAVPLLDLLKESGLTTLQVLDAADNVLSVTDPRLLYANVTTGTDYQNLACAYDMAGNPLFTRSADAGPRWALSDVFGNPAHAWDGQSVLTTRSFDRLARLTQVTVSDITRTGPVTTELIAYGETQGDPAQRNLNGRVWRHYDPAGLLTTPAYTLAGQPVTVTRQVRADYQREADWTPEAMAAVARQPAYTAAYRYDAMGRLLAETAPNAAAVISAYSQAGQLVRVTARVPGGDTPVIEGIEYNANGQRTAIRYGNRTATSHHYEDTTLRLLTISTTGPARPLQDIRYTFDPVGNVTQTENRSPDAAFCYPQPVSPAARYGYDPLYRLVHATGREAPPEAGPAMPFCPPEPPPRRHLVEYAERYGYDDGGNLISVEHAGATTYVRRFDVAAGSNRLASEPYDGNGNLTALGDLRRLDWNTRGVLVRATLADGAGAEFYCYDADGARVLKADGRRETSYVGAYQVTRTGDTERQAVSVADDRARVCLIEHDTGTGGWSFRYQLDDNLGSVAWELDGSGEPLNYQEFLPYGASAFLADAGGAGAAGKEFRYAGKELDAGTGLYYYGARYYSPAYGRWLSPDPRGAGLNLYAFVEGNPVSKTDTTGGVGFWVMWGISVLGALTTLAVGGYGLILGHGRGAASGTFMGVVAGVAGTGTTAVAALVVGAPTADLATVAVHSALAAAAGALAGGFSGEQAMRLVTAYLPARTRTIGTVGTLVAALVGGMIGRGISSSLGPVSLIAIATGLGSAVLSSGGPMAFADREAPVNPTPLHDLTQIVQALHSVNGVPVVLMPGRRLLVLAPQPVAEARFRSFRKHFAYQRDASAIFRRRPDRPASGPLNTNAYHAVIAHGALGFVMVPVATGANQWAMRPVLIQGFARYVRARLGVADIRPIKFISCFGADSSIIMAANAQIMADITHRRVIAFTGKNGEQYTGDWKTFHPR